MPQLLRRFPPYRAILYGLAQRKRRQRQDAAWEHTHLVLIDLGNITICWAGISLILNRFIEAYQNTVGTVIRKDIPRDFTQKLKYLKEVEKDIRWTEHQRTTLRRYRLELAEHNEFRVNLVHGFLSRRGYSPEWDIHVAKETGNSLLRRNIRHSAKDIHNFAMTLDNLGSEMSRFFAPILGIKRPDLIPERNRTITK